MRIIKKYPNRRLYDMAISSYITLDDIKKLILDHIPFRVLDARSEEDMTNYVLLQIISEQENTHSPIFTTEILQNIIRFYGNPLQKTMSQFLEQSLAWFTEHKAEPFKVSENNPFNMLTDLAKQNMALWQSAFSQYAAKKPETKASQKKKPKS